MPRKKIENQENPNEKRIQVDGNEVHLTNQEKIYYPDDNITKGDVINYYDEMYKYIGPYLEERPESLKRQPQGISDKGFFQKNVDDQPPTWVKTVTLHSDSENKDINYIICNDRATLLYLGNLGCIEINPWFSKLDSLDNPDYMVIDIDPSQKNDFDQVIEAALAVKEVLDKGEVSGYCKTSGASGMHVFVPLAAKYTYDNAKDLSHIIAMKAQELLPDITSLERNLSKRGNKIYLDYLQNRRGQTLASVYSLRPEPGATVSAPLEWKELKKGLHYSKFTIKTMPKRVQKMGDIFNPVMGKGIDIKKCLKKLGA